MVVAQGEIWVDSINYRIVSEFSKIGDCDLTSLETLVQDRTNMFCRNLPLCNQTRQWFSVGTIARLFGDSLLL